MRFWYLSRDFVCLFFFCGKLLGEYLFIYYLFLYFSCRCINIFFLWGGGGVEEEEGFVYRSNGFIYFFW